MEEVRYSAQRNDIVMRISDIQKRFRRTNLTPQEAWSESCNIDAPLYEQRNSPPVVIDWSYGGRKYLVDGGYLARIEAAPGRS